MTALHIFYAVNMLTDATKIFCKVIDSVLFGKSIFQFHHFIQVNFVL